MSDLLGGVARAIINPPVGIPLSGFACRGPAEGVHEDLLATALALQCGDTRVVLIAADLIGFGERFTAEVRREIERRAGVAPGSVLLCASHTHYGPATGAYEENLPPDAAAYMANLRFLLAGAVEEALSRLGPVRLGWGHGASEIGINRRERRPDGQIVLGKNPDGPCDRELGVVRLDTAEGRPLAALVNFACHPVSAGARMRRVSPGYIGPMRRLLESSTGATCLFLQGAAGNINPIEMWHSFEPARRLGVMLGGEAARVFEGIAAEPATGLAAARQRVELPALCFNCVHAGEDAVAGLQAHLSRLRAENASAGALYWAETRLERAERMLESRRAGISPPPVPAELSALRVGDVALVTAPGEIFTETGMLVKRRSPFPRTCFAGYTNGAIGYVPVPPAYDEGGYEVTHACRVAPEAAGMIVETSLRLLTQLA